MPPLTGFIGPAYQARSLSIAADRLVNLYPEVVETTQGKNVAALYSTPGLRKGWQLPGSGGIRGLYTASNGRVFGVRGSQVSELTRYGGVMPLGLLQTVSGPVSMADNGRELAIADGPNGYMMQFTDSVVQRITDPDFPGTSHWVYLDGYFVYIVPRSGQFGITGLFEGSSIDALDTATAEGLPDLLVSIVADHRELWLFGFASIEVWFNTGNPDFPFERIQGAFIEYGCEAPFSPVKLDNTVYWIGSNAKGNRMIFRANGYQPQRISTHAIEFAIAQYPQESIVRVRGYGYQEEGHSFYCLNFSDTTWCYDVSTGLWHERAFLQDSGILTRHRGECHTSAFGEQLVGDFEDGRVHIFDLNYASDDGAEMPSIRTCPHMHADRKRLRLHRCELDLESGIGRDGGQEPGVDPVVTLRLSKDGARTWGREHRATIGKLGEYTHRAKWERLGQARTRTIEIRQTDPVRRAWINAHVTASVGTS